MLLILVVGVITIIKRAKNTLCITISFLLQDLQQVTNTIMTPMLVVRQTFAKVMPDFSISKSINLVIGTTDGSRTGTTKVVPYLRKEEFMEKENAGCPQPLCHLLRLHHHLRLLRHRLPQNNTKIIRRSI